MSNEKVTATTSTKQKQSFQDWWDSPKIRRLTGGVYSLGASVVIVGALFKILHLPGATEMLMTGMLTEAVLFAIGVFDAPHKDFSWENVFPILLQKESKPFKYESLQTGGSIGGNGGGNGGNVGSNGGGAMVSGSVAGVTGLKDEEVKALQESITRMSKTAHQISDLSSAANVTKEYTDSLSLASKAASGYAEKQSKLKDVSENLAQSYVGITEQMSQVQSDTKNFANHSSAINSNLNAINAAYEMQLKNVQTQSNEISKQGQHFGSISTEIENFSNAVKTSAQNMVTYTQLTETLSKNVSNLNNVYGNMLNSLKS